MAARVLLIDVGCAQLLRILLSPVGMKIVERIWQWLRMDIDYLASTKVCIFYHEL